MDYNKYPIKRKSITDELFEIDPTSDEYYFKFIDNDTSSLYDSLDRDDPNFLDKLEEYRKTTLMDPSIQREDNDRGLSIFKEDKTSGFSKYIGDQYNKDEGQSNIFSRLKDKVNIDELSKGIFGEKGVDISENFMGAVTGVIGAETSQVNSKAASTMQGVSMGMKGAKLGTSIGGPVGGIIGGIGGLTYGLIDGRNDLKKIREEKKRKYNNLLEEIKENRKRNYEASKGSSTNNYNKF